MIGRVRLVLGLAAASVLAVGSPASAEIRRCGPTNLGERTCQVGNVCVCSAQTGTTNRTGNGYVWDCDLAYGTCGTSAGGGTSAVLYLNTPAAKRVDLREGEQGPDALDREAVARLQRRLNTIGLDAGPADGVIGPRTRNAIRIYQEQKGYPIDGRATPDLLATLE
jgi:murein L,D-transpeptidase YcbB/YkuD